MIVFGGCRGDSTACDVTLGVDGNDIYDAVNDAWLPLSTESAPTARLKHTAVLTNDDEMIVWGGLDSLVRPTQAHALQDGAILMLDDEAPQGVWHAMPETVNTPAARFGHTAIWTGKEMLIWGGCNHLGPTGRCTKDFADGAFFNPHAEEKGLDPWRPLPAPDFLVGRVDHSAIWSGHALIVWGGKHNAATLTDGGIYTEEDGWRRLSDILPDGEFGRSEHSAAYEPLRGRMIIWGGKGQGYPSSTLVYDIGGNTWSRAATQGDPIGRTGQTSTWIQDSLVVWGGLNPSSGFIGSGGIFNP
jgi:hypothetical protein